MQALFSIRKLMWTSFFLMVFSAQANAYCFFWQDCKAYKTQYPIVLVHGVAGFSSVLGVDYFYGVADALEDRGATVYAPNVTAIEDAYVRGEQLIDYLDDLKAVTGKQKFNLMGHSLGGPTIRYVAGVRPDLVASVTTISGANGGSEFADILRGAVPEGSTLEGVIETALNLLGAVIDTLSGNSEYSQDAIDSVAFLTTQGADEFNALFPDGKPTSECGNGDSIVNGIRYYSWGGDTEFTNIFDISDPFLVFTGAFFEGANDGLVGRCAQHWGKSLGNTYNMNHLDTVNLFFGIHHLFETDPLTLYKNHATRLKNKGL